MTDLPSLKVRNEVLFSLIGFKKGAQ